MAVERELVAGVIGGLGPEATLDFFGKVLAHSHASQDQDHIHLIIENNPKTPNRNEAIAGRGPSPGPALAAMARGLERAGADFVLMACNTAHAFEADICAALTKPFVSMIDEVVDHVCQDHSQVQCVGLLATQGCLDAGLYQKAFARCRVETIQLPETRQAHLMELIYRIKSGRHDTEITEEMQQLGEELIAAGSGLIIAACTEVPLVLHNGQNSRPLVDSTGVLARAAVAYARRQRPLPSPATFRESAPL